MAQRLVHVRFGALNGLRLNVAPSPFRADFVAKLGGTRLARNNRIVGKEFLNRCCSLGAVLESMLPAQAPKIVLQHYLHRTDLPRCLVSSRYWGVCGHIADMLRPPPLTRTGRSIPCPTTQVRYGHQRDPRVVSAKGLTD